MRSLFISLVIFMGSMTHAGVLPFGIELPSELSKPDQLVVQNFVLDVHTKLPERMREKLSFEGHPVHIKFRQLDQHKTLPLPKCTKVSGLDKANAIRKEFKKAIKMMDAATIRYDGAVHARVRKRGGTTWGLRTNNNTRFVITIHSGFLPYILQNSKKTELPCGNGSMKKVAEASFVHAFARAYDLTEYHNDEEYRWATKLGGHCREAREELKKKTRSQRLTMNPAQHHCLDVLKSETLISEKRRYRTIAGNWTGRKGKYTESNNAMWPRAVNPYVNAHDVQTNFAYHMEKFVLDPEFACRLPVIHEYLADHFGDPHDSVNRGLCSVNTEIRVDSVLMNESGRRYVDLEYYDLNPSNVEQIYYYRAGSDDSSIAGAFGHSMYRVVSKADGSLQVGGCPDASQGFSCDLIINHRANPMELQLDNVKATFGGYPSQLLVKSIYDIRQEYGDLELRNIINVPLGFTNESGFQPMAEDEKKRFLYATLEQYWSYLGNYKFVTNNCADEAMRLYTIGSDHPGVQYANILSPRDIELKVLRRLGRVDREAMDEIKETGFVGNLWKKIAFWEKWEWVGLYQKRYEEERKSAEESEWVDESRRYTLFDAVAELIVLENEAIRLGKRRPDLLPRSGEVLSDPTIRNADNIVVVEEELKNWVELATISEDKGEVCKVNAQFANTDARIQKTKEKIQYFKNRYDELMGFYEGLYQESGDQKYWEKMYQVNKAFYLALYYAEKKRQKQIGEMAVQIAYEIAYPNNGKPMKCKGDLSWQIPGDKVEMVKQRIDVYSLWESQLQPYSDRSAAPGYGIPLFNEMSQGELIVAMANEQRDRLKELVRLLHGEIGMDYRLWVETKLFRRDLCVDRLDRSLFKRKAPNCQVIFADVYGFENNNPEWE